MISFSRPPVATPVAAADRPTVDPYEAFAKKVAGLLGTADKEATRLVEEAKRESARIIEEARAEADRIRLDAQSNAEEARAEAERMLEAARAEAERALSGLAGRRQTLMDQLQTMQTRLLSAAKDLDVTIEDRPADLPQPLVDAEAKAEAKGGAGTEAQVPEGDDIVEPGYEDLWVSSDEVGALSDLATMEFDFDAEDRPNT